MLVLRPHVTASLLCWTATSACALLFALLLVSPAQAEFFCCGFSSGRQGCGLVPEAQVTQCHMHAFLLN